MTFQADLVLARHMCTASCRAGAKSTIPTFDEIADREIARIEIIRTVCGLDSPAAAQHAGGNISMPGHVVMGSRLGPPSIIEQTILQHPVRIMTIGAFDMTVTEIEVRLVLAQVGIQSCMYFTYRLLVAVGYRHMRQAGYKIGFNIGHLEHGITLAVQHTAIGGMTGVAGFLQRRVAAGLGAQKAIGAFSQQMTRSLHRMGVMAVQATCPPHRQI